MKLETYKNSWALITGASSGIGKEFAKAFAEEGINVVLLARREELLNSVAKELEEKYKIETRTVKFDLNKTDQLKSVYDLCSDINIEIVINNAGFGDLGELSNLSDEKIIEMINVNCVAPTLLTKHFTERMKKNKRGIVVFLGSILSYFPTPLMSLYSATKVFNSFLGEGLIFELEKYGIKSYVLNPGSTDTDFHRVANNNKGLNVRQPEQVVKRFLANGKTVFDDGIANRLLLFVKRFLPRRVTYFIMKEFIKRNNNI